MLRQTISSTLTAIAVMLFTIATAAGMYGNFAMACPGDGDCQFVQDENDPGIFICEGDCPVGMVCDSYTTIDPDDPNHIVLHCHCADAASPPPIA